MNRRIPVILTLILLASLLVLTACGGNAEEDPEPAAAAAEQVQAETVDSPEETAVPQADDQAAQDAGSETAGESGGFQTFVIDPDRSQAYYMATEELFEEALTKYGLDPGFNEVTGTTPGVEGQIQLNLDNLNDLVGQSEFVVDLTQLTTDQDFRDQWIQDNGPRFADFPQAVFTVNEVSGLPDAVPQGETVNFQMSGDLTVRGETQPVTFDVTATLDGDILSGEAESSGLLMSDFGIEPPSFARTLSVNDQFGILVEFTAVAQ